MAAPKTASFTSPGVAPPYAAEMQTNAYEQQQLLDALAQQQAGQQGGANRPIQAGRLSALNFEGAGNAIAEVLTKKKLEAARKKQADTQGAYSEALLRASRKYQGERDGSTADVAGPPIEGEGQPQRTTPGNPLAFKGAAMSPFPEIRGVADEDRKSYEELRKTLLGKASPQSALASPEDIRGLRPEVKQQVANGAVIQLGQEAGEKPQVVAPVTQSTLPSGTVVNNQFGGAQEAVERAPKVSVHNTMPGQKGETRFLETTGENVAKRAEELQKSTPGQLRALADAELASKKGAFQGPVSANIQWAASMLHQFGMAPETSKAFLQNTETLNSDMGRFVLQAIKATGTNPSNSDREYAAQTAGDKKLTPAGLQAVVRAGRVDILNNILEHNRTVDRVKGTMPAAELARLPLPKAQMDLSGYALNEDGQYMPTGEGKPQARPGPRLTPQQRQRLLDAGITPSGE